jgi:O-antigen ligase
MSDSQTEGWLDKGMFILLLAAMAFGPLATGAVRPQDFLVIQLLVGSALLLWAARLWVDRRHQILWVPACWGVLAFVGYALVRTSQADLRMVGTQELSRVLVYASVFLVALHSARSEERSRILTYALAALGTLISAYAIFQFATGSSRVWMFVRPASYAGRGSGTYICPNHLAGFLAMVIPLASALVIGGRTPVLGRVLLAYSVLMMLAGSAVSISRGGWIATASGLLTLVLIHAWKGHRTWRAWTLLAAGVALACILASQSLTVRERAKKLTGGYVFGNSIELRLALWSGTSAMWRDHFWWGVGPGHFDHRFPAYRPPIVQRRPGYAHNDYLNALADWGTAGMLLVALTAGLSGLAAVRGLRQASPRPRRDSSQSSDRLARLTGATAGLVAILAHSCVDFNMQIPANAIVAVILLAQINAHLCLTSSRYWLRPGMATKILFTFALLACAGWLSLQGWRTAREAYYLRIAAREKRQTAVRLEALERAIKVRPDNFETTYALGEAYRQLSWQGNSDYALQARKAIEWLERSAAANLLDPYAPIRTGMCLDWLGEHTKAAPYYDRALSLDPNNHFLCTLRGWHHLQAAEFAKATRWFRRSLQLKHWPNPTARRFLYKAIRLLKDQQAAQTLPPDAGPGQP